MQVMTIKEFNLEYGKNTYGVNRYKMASKDDLNTYVSMLPEYGVIPYFCEWLQDDSYYSIKEKVTKGHNKIIYIIANHDIKKENKSVRYEHKFKSKKEKFYDYKNVNVWTIPGGYIVQHPHYSQFDYVVDNMCISQLVGFNLEWLEILIKNKVDPGDYTKKFELKKEMK